MARCSSTSRLARLATAPGALTGNVPSRGLVLPQPFGCPPLDLADTVLSRGCLAGAIGLHGVRVFSFLPLLSSTATTRWGTRRNDDRSSGEKNGDANDNGSNVHGILIAPGRKWPPGRMPVVTHAYVCGPRLFPEERVF